jgi:hypothetical protein
MKGFCYVLIFFSVTTVFSQTIVIETFPKTVPEGKKWTISVGNEIMAELNNTALNTGSYCNALILSHPRILGSIIEGDYGRPNEAYSILFRELNKVPFTNDYTFSLIPESFVDINFNIQDLHGKRLDEVGVKEIIFYPGQRVYVTQCLIGIQVKETTLTQQDINNLREREREKSIIEEERLLERQRLTEQERLRQQEELSNFLKEREVKQYEYSILSESHFNQLRSELEQGISEILSGRSENIRFDLSIDYLIDTLGHTTVNYNLSNNIANPIREKITDLINSKQLNPVHLRQYLVFAKAQYIFHIDLKTNIIELTKFSNDINFISGDFRTFSTNKEFIKSELTSKNNPIGTYEITYVQYSINQQLKNSLVINSFKSFSGPSAAFASVLIPGLGKRYVTGGQRNGVGTTISVYSLIGGGIASKLLSNSYYSNYQNATMQSDMDNYYTLANNLNKATYFLIGAGALIWLHDIYWVANKGSQNKKNTLLMNQRINLSLGSDLNNNLQLGLTINF